MNRPSPYYHGTTRLSTGYMTPAEYSNEFRHIADVMPDTAPDADMRRQRLRERAAEIDNGEVSPFRHFRVIVPCYRTTKGGRKVLSAVAYPCSGYPLYTFDEAWILLETFAAKRGYDPYNRDGLECHATSSNQNMDLSIIYDGIAEPTRSPVRLLCEYRVAALANN